MDHQSEMAYGKSNGHVIDDVTSVAGGRRCARLVEVSVRAPLTKRS